MKSLQRCVEAAINSRCPIIGAADACILRSAVARWFYIQQHNLVLPLNEDDVVAALLVVSDACRTGLQFAHVLSSFVAGVLGRADIKLAARVASLSGVLQSWMHCHIARHGSALDSLAMWLDGDVLAVGRTPSPSCALSTSKETTSGHESEFIYNVVLPLRQLVTVAATLVFWCGDTDDVRALFLKPQQSCLRCLIAATCALQQSVSSARGTCLSLLPTGAQSDFPSVQLRLLCWIAADFDEFCVRRITDRSCSSPLMIPHPQQPHGGLWTLRDAAMLTSSAQAVSQDFDAAVASMASSVKAGNVVLASLCASKALRRPLMLCMRNALAFFSLQKPVEHQPNGDVVATRNRIAPHVVVGLRNSGNTCFLNAALQILWRMRSLVASILSSHNVSTASLLSALSQTLGSTPASSLTRCTSASDLKTAQGAKTWAATAVVLSELEWVTRQPPHVSRDALDVSYFAAAMPAPFHNGLQHDASEFFKVLLDALDSAAPQSIHRASTESHTTGTNSRSAIGAALAGTLIYETLCCRCSTVSKSRDVFWDLPVPLPPGQRCTEARDASGRCSLLPALLHDTYAASWDVADVLDGDDKFVCETCGTRERALRRTRLAGATSHGGAVAPPFLLLHLLRYSTTNHSGGGDVAIAKDHQRVVIPFTMDVEFVLEQSPVPTSEPLDENVEGIGNSKTRDEVAVVSVKYRTAGCVVHHGATPHSGHYVALICTSVHHPALHGSTETTYAASQWVLANDSSVSDVSSDAVEEFLGGRVQRTGAAPGLRGTPYMVLLEKVSDDSTAPDAVHLLPELVELFARRHRENLQKDVPVAVVHRQPRRRDSDSDDDEGQNRWRTGLNNQHDGRWIA